MNKLKRRLQTRGLELMLKLREKLMDNRGDSQSTGTTVLIIGAIVIGAVLIVALIAVFKDTLIPLITQKIKELFNL